MILISRKPHSGEKRKLRLINQKAPFAFVEAYNSLRTNIDYLAATNHYKTFLITSSGPSDGTTKKPETQQPATEQPRVTEKPKATVKPEEPVKPEQPRNAELPMEVTLVPIVSDPMKPEHPKKALPPMEDTPVPMSSVP